jgi:hypothetical protein
MITIGLAIALAVTVAAGCSDSGDDPATGNTEIEFGRGVMPETVPSDFPVPTEAVINATLVDGANNRTEVNMLFPAEIAVVARFFDVNLVNRGYLVGSSTGTELSWTIEFSKDQLSGTIELVPQTETTTSATLDITTR